MSEVISLEQLAASVKFLELEKLSNGMPVSNLDNCVRILENHSDFAGRIWFDTFLHSIMTDWQGESRRWTDRDTSMLTVYFQREFGLISVDSRKVHEAVLCAAFTDQRNECREYLESVVWDRIPRLNMMLERGFGAIRDEYSEAVGRCWMTSMVARVFDAGCQVDTVPVFEGNQGSGKSSALRIIGGKWFTESHEQVTSKDFYLVMQGAMLIEIAEMHGFSKAEVTKIKGVISNRVDRLRAPYGRITEDHPRQCVFACTTNETEWQRDETGARRFWPIATTKVDLEWLKANRDQLFAEAVTRYKNGEGWWDVPQESHAIEVEKRREIDPLEPIIIEILNKRNAQPRFTITELMILMGHSAATITKKDSNRIGKILRSIGCRTTVSGGSRYWIKPALTDDEF